MFIIIGGDGKEYGPVTADQIRSWITGGRANLDTKAKAAGTEEWRRLGDHAEFAGASVSPPVMSAAGTMALAEGAEFAGRGNRLGAWFIDNAIAFVLCLPGLLLAGTSVLKSIAAGQRNPENMDTARLLMGFGVMGVALLALAIVQIWMLSTRGQTLGKRMLAIRIVRFTDGGNPGFLHAVLLRGFVPGVIGAIPYIGWIFTIVNICFIFRDDQRCLHDLMAGTRVVKV